VQLRGPRNRRAAPEIWQATLGWLSQQTFRPLPRISETSDRPRRQQLIRAIWRPMLDSVKGTAMEPRIQALSFGKEISRSYRAFQGAPDAAAGAAGARRDPSQEGDQRMATSPLRAASWVLEGLD
jgi:hypothetical protein